MMKSHASHHTRDQKFDMVKHAKNTNNVAHYCGMLYYLLFAERKQLFKFIKDKISLVQLYLPLHGLIHLPTIIVGGMHNFIGKYPHVGVPSVFTPSISYTSPHTPNTQNTPNSPTPPFQWHHIWYVHIFI